MWPRLSTSWSSDLESSGNSVRLEDQSRDDPICTPTANGENKFKGLDVIHDSNPHLNGPRGDLRAPQVVESTSHRWRGDLVKSVS